MTCYVMHTMGGADRHARGGQRWAAWKPGKYADFDRGRPAPPGHRPHLRLLCLRRARLRPGANLDRVYIGGETGQPCVARCIGRDFDKRGRRGASPRRCHPGKSRPCKAQAMINLSFLSAPFRRRASLPFCCWLGIACALMAPHRPRRRACLANRRWKPWPRTCSNAGKPATPKSSPPRSTTRWSSLIRATVSISRTSSRCSRTYHQDKTDIKIYFGTLSGGGRPVRDDVPVCRDRPQERRATGGRHGGERTASKTASSFFIKNSTTNTSPGGRPPRKFPLDEGSFHRLPVFAPARSETH